MATKITSKLIDTCDKCGKETTLYSNINIVEWYCKDCYDKSEG